MFHHSLDFGTPELLPEIISLPEIRHFLRFVHEEIQYSAIHGKLFGSCMLRRLGPPQSYRRNPSYAHWRGKSQTDIPTKRLFFTANSTDTSAEWLQLETNRNVVLPVGVLDRFSKLAPSTIKLGRVVEDLDCPFERYYDSELPSFSEAAVSNQGTSSLEIKPQQGRYYPYLWTKAINTHWSVCSDRKMDPVFEDSSAQKLLIEWISNKKVAFLITAYQTCVDTTIQHSMTISSKSTYYL